LKRIREWETEHVLHLHRSTDRRSRYSEEFG
jgi:hypothetical protein